MPPNNRNSIGVSKGKRQNAEYKNIDDDDEIAFVVDKKRARFESGDSNQSDVSEGSDVSSMSRQLSAEEQLWIAMNSPWDCLDEDCEDEEDTRQVNRRSPNGFMLPDPIPKGEILTDTKNQASILTQTLKSQ